MIRLTESGNLDHLVVRALVEVVVDWFEPGGSVTLDVRLDEDDVAHEGVGGGAVPVLLVLGAPDDVAGAEPDDELPPV
jgi:hypothetical protein